MIKKKKKKGIRDNNNAAITINQEGNLRGTPIFFVIAIYSVSA
jgi:ribosomal protein L14